MGSFAAVAFEDAFDGSGILNSLPRPHSNITSEAYLVTSVCCVEFSEKEFFSWSQFPSPALQKLHTVLTTHGSMPGSAGSSSDSTMKRMKFVRLMVSVVCRIKAVALDGWLTVTGL